MRLLFTCSTLGFGLAFLGCGPTYSPALKTLEAQVQTLQSHCRENKIQSAQTHHADSLFKHADAVAKTGETDEAQIPMEQALIRYRSALITDELNRNQKKAEELKVIIAQDKKQLQRYRQILAELKELRTK